VRAARVAALIAVASLAGPASLAGARAPAAAAAKLPSALSVNGLSRPVGVDPDDVELAWRLADGGGDVRQSGYRIIVATRATSDPTAKAVVWDSGIVASAQQAFVRYGGPALSADTDYWWTVATMTVTQNQVGQFARPQPFVTGLRERDWRAVWVRPGTSSTLSDRYTYVRTAAPVGSSPIVRATAYIAAAHQYQLWVNGRLLGSGPAFAYPDEQYWQAIDVTGAVKAGVVNVVGVLHRWYGAGQGRPESAPGLLAQVSVVHRDGTHELIATGDSWREHPAEWKPAPPRNDEGDFVEHIDARAAPGAWASSAFDDSSWTPVTVLGPVGTAPFTRLVAQRTRIETHPVRAVSARRLRDGTVIADFGAVIAATPTVTFRHGRAGRAIQMRVGFVLDADGHVSTRRATQDTNLSYEYTQRDGTQTFRPFGYLAFRYLEVDAPGEPLASHQLVAYARHTAMPGTPGTPATFRSSDPTLNAVWQLTTRSALYSAQDQFVDTPTREKGQFLADAFNESQAVMRAFQDQNLTRQALLEFAHSQTRYWPDGRLNAVYPNGDGARDIPDFTERYPEWVWQYYLATGDRETLAQLYSVVRRITDYVWRAVDPASGLVTRLPGGDGDYLFGIVDWPPAMRYRYDVSTVARTTVNLLAVNAFRRAGAIATVVGQPSDAVVEQDRAKTLGAAVDSRLVRDDGVFVDGITANGSPSAHASQQANALALAYGDTPDQDKVLGEYVAKLGISVGPLNGLALLRALHTSGRDADLVRVLTDRKDPGWAHIVASGGTFTWESWTPFDALGDSTSHGWGSDALVAMQEAILGVTPVEPPGIALGPKFEVRAPTAGPARVRGSVPSVAGPIRVQWARRGGTVTLRLVVPPNASADVAFPGQPARTVGSGTYSFRGPA